MPASLDSPKPGTIHLLQYDREMLPPASLRALVTKTHLAQSIELVIAPNLNPLSPPRGIGTLDSLLG